MKITRLVTRSGMILSVGDTTVFNGTVEEINYVVDLLSTQADNVNIHEGYEVSIRAHGKANNKLVEVPYHSVEYVVMEED